MDGLKNYREKINSIEKLVDKMENGELSIHELVELETLTRDLHERSIILKYKAFEGKAQVVVAPIVEEKVVVQEEEVLEEEEVEVEDESVDEAPMMDFSMFGESSKKEEKPTETRPNHQINLSQSDDIEDVVEAFEPKVEPKVEEKTAPIIERKPEQQAEVKAEIKEEPKAEEPIVVVKEKGSSFLDRLSILDNSISSQLAGRKLDTLSGAFGINERLLYINELFDGSGEAFSDAVKTLDTQSNLDAASVKVEELAFKNSWNPEEEVVLEFLAIIKRRYA